MQLRSSVLLLASLLFASLLPSTATAGTTAAVKYQRVRAKPAVKVKLANGRKVKIERSGDSFHVLVQKRVRTGAPAKAGAKAPTRKVWARVAGLSAAEVKPGETRVLAGVTAGKQTFSVAVRYADGKSNTQDHAQILLPDGKSAVTMTGTRQRGFVARTFGFVEVKPTSTVQVGKNVQVGPNVKIGGEKLTLVDNTHFSITRRLLSLVTEGGHGLSRAGMAEEGQVRDALRTQPLVAQGFSTTGTWFKVSQHGVSAVGRAPAAGSSARLMAQETLVTRGRSVKIGGVRVSLRGDAGPRTSVPSKSTKK